MGSEGQGRGPTASKTPLERSCASTSCGSKALALSALLGLMQRMKWASVDAKASCSLFRSLMKRRPTELNRLERWPLRPGTAAPSPACVHAHVCSYTRTYACA